MHHIQDAHEDFILGIDWDPADEFIVSLSNDRSLRFWSTQDYKCRGMITSAYKKMSSRSFQKRLSWMPTGQGVISSSGTDPIDKTHTHVAPVISRDRVIKSTLKGHRGMITVAVRVLENTLSFIICDFQTYFIASPN